VDLLTFGAAFLAGILTFLNPCVLPVLPIVFGAAANEHRFGPLALATGLALSFTVVGLVVATIGFSLGPDAELFRSVSAAMLVLFGILLAVPQAQTALQTAMGPVASWAAERSQRHEGAGLAGQMALGALLGAVWSPCIGPTLGAATLIASQGDQLPQVALAMFLFGVGAAVPLLLIGTVFRARLARLRGRLGQAGRTGKLLLGGGMVVAGAMVLTGLDKTLEVLLLNISPAWLTTLSTSL
jgi:cytochrome c-type biogenesis protein